MKVILESREEEDEGRNNYVGDKDRMRTMTMRKGRKDGEERRK